MFDGEPETVTIEFDDSLLGPVYDKFGEDISINRVAEDKCQTTVAVQLSPTFFGWLIQFGEKVTVVEPTEVRTEIRNTIEELSRSYSD